MFNLQSTNKLTRFKQPELPNSVHVTCFPCTRKVVMCGAIEEENFWVNAAP